MRHYITLFFLVLSISVSAQLSKKHYFPPLVAASYGSGNPSISAVPQDGYIYLSTPSQTDVSVEIYYGNNLVPEAVLTVSNSNPVKHDLPFDGSPSGNDGWDSPMSTDLDENKENDFGVKWVNKGVRVVADGEIYANFRLNGSTSNAQGEMISSKGTAALGKTFWTGHLTNYQSVGDRTNFVSVMSVSDNNSITLTPKNSSVDVKGLGTGSSHTITLNRFESFVFVATPYDPSLNLGQDNVIQGEAFIGALLQSSNDIVVNVGSINGNMVNTGGVVEGGRDHASDQIVPLERVGTDYVLVKGNGINVHEVPIIVATEPNTNVYYNDNANPVTLAAAGDFYVSEPGTDNYYDGDIMALYADKPIYVYQPVMANDQSQTQGMFFVPPINCSAPRFLDLVSDIDKIGTKDFTGRLNLLVRDTATTTIEINGTTYTLGTNNPNNTTFAGVADFNPNSSVSGYEAWKIDQLTGDVSVNSTADIYVGVFGYVGNAGIGAYFSGFSQVPEIISATAPENCTPSLITATAGFDNYQWYFNGSPIAGETNETLNATVPGNYYVEAGVSGCPPDESEILTLIDADFVDAGDDLSICPNADAQLDGSSSEPDADLEWETLGDGSFNNIYLANAVYTPGSNDITNGSVSLVLNGDNRGCIDADTLLLTLEDDEDPVIICPEDFMVNTEPGTCIGYAGDYNVSTTDNCTESGNFTYNDNPSKNTPLELGDNTITVIAIDESGNEGVCEFIVTVVDNQSPTANCPSDITVDTDAGVCEAVVYFEIPGADDNCGATSSADISSGSTFDLGSTTVTVTATDDAGNTDTCTFTVTVVDNEPLVVNCPDDIIVDTEPGICEAEVTYEIPEPTDNCGATSEVDIPSGTIFNVGTTTVTVSAQGSNPVDSLIETFSATTSSNNGRAGSGVAVSDDGNTIAYSDRTGTCKTTVYEKIGGVWTQKGSSVSGVSLQDSQRAIGMSANGNRIVTGAQYYPASGLEYGLLRVYDWDGTDWVQLGSDIVGTNQDGELGVSLAMSDDGTYFIAGGFGAGVPLGSAYIYKFDGTDWVQHGQTLIGVQGNGWFGISVDMSADGSSVVVGQRRLNNRFMVYDFDTASNQWVQRGPDLLGSAYGINVGTTVSMSADGNTVASGGPETTVNLAQQGGVVVLDWDGSSWVQKGPVILGGTIYEYFGSSLGLSDSGDKLYAGSKNYLGNNVQQNATGRASLLEWDGTSWNMIGNFVTGNGLGSSNFGQRGNISGDASTIVVGGIFEDSNGYTNNGIFKAYDTEDLEAEECTFTVTVEDNEAPDAVCNDLELTLDANGEIQITAADVDAGSTDNCGIASVELDADDQDWDCAEAGSHVVTLTVTDDSGNESECYGVVIIEDDTPPTIVCNDLTVSVNSSGFYELDPEVVGAGSTDNCGEVDLTYSLDENIMLCEDAGSVVTVTLTVTDGSGNSSTCEAEITVEDNTPPTVLECMHDLTFTTDPGVCTANSPFEDWTYIYVDNCLAEGLTVTDDNVYNYDFPVGTTTVTLTFTDNAGNAATCSFDITVTDDEDPDAVCQDITIELDDEGEAFIVAEDLDGGSTDNCGIASFDIAADDSDWDCGEVGDNTVVLTVTDIYGNSSTCEAIVTVEDNEAPIFNCVDATVELDENGEVLDVLAIIYELVMVSSSGDNGSFNSGVTDFTVPVLTSQTLTFDWDYTTDDGPNWDTFGYLLNGVYYQLTSTSGGNDQSGTTTVVVSAGDVFGFRSYTVDNIVGPSTTTVSNFVPGFSGEFDPGNWTLLLVNSDGNASFNTSSGIYAEDNCGIASVSVSPNMFDCDDLGPNTVIVTAVDVNGNESTCETTITVEDNTSPISECQDITVYLDDLGEACVTAQEIDGGSTDNCDITLQEIGTLVGPDPSALTVYALQPWDSNDNISSYSYNSTTDELVLDANPHASTGLSSNYALSVNPVDNKVYLLADSDATGERALFEYDIVNGTVIAELGDVVSVNGSDKPNAMEFDDAGNLYVAFGGGGEINTLNISTMTTAAFSQVSYSGAAGLAYDPDGSRLIYASGDDPSINLSAIALGSGTVTNLFDFEIDPGCCTAQGIEYVSGGKLISAGTYGGNTIYTIDLNTQEVTTLLEPTGSYSSIKSLLVYPPTSIELQDPCVEFGCDDIGENDVVLINTDQSGNASNCSSTVTVVDSIAPEAICEDITIQLDENGEATITAEDVDGGSTDACGIESIEIASDDEDWNCDEVGENTVVLTVTDNNGNESTCEATVTVEDNLPPILECADIVINLDPGLCGAVVDYDVESTDNCGVASEVTVSGPESGEYLDYHDGPWTVTMDVTDVNGNVSSCDFTITMNEYDNPTETLACNDHVLVALDEDGCSIIGADMILEGGPYGCYDDYEVSVENGDLEVCCDQIGSELTVVVTDPDTGNSCEGTIEVYDNLTPYCVSIEDYTIACEAELPSEDDTTHPGYPVFGDNCGVDQIYMSVQTVLDGDICSDPGMVVERIWYAIDVNGNIVEDADVCTQTITIERTPLTFPTDQTYDCAAYDVEDLTPDLTGEPTPAAAAACMYHAVYSDQVLPLCGGLSKIIRTWTVMDWCTGEVILTDGNGTSHVQVIKLMDGDGPSIDATDIVVGTDSDACGFTGFIPAPSITDNCTGVALVQMFIPGLPELEYVYDAAGDLAGGLVGEPGIDLGSVTLLIIATDACGNISEEEVTVTVEDQTEPLPICDEITQVAVSTDGLAEVFAETFDDGSYDNCCLDGFDVTRMDDGEFGPSVVFDCADINETVQVIFRAHDCFGNSNVCMVEVLVEDKIAPYLAVPAGTEISCEDYFANIAAELDAGNGAILDDLYGEATYGDNCEAILDYSYTYGVDQCGEGTITRSWTVNDPSGNGPVSGTQTITIYHVSDWSISFPGDLDATCVDGELPDFGTPTVSDDDCEMIAISYIDTQFDVVPDACYKIVREWSAINWCTYPDEAAVTATQVIKVTDDEAPIFDVEDFTVDITEADCDVAVTLPTPDVTDCSDDITIETSSDLPAGEAGPGTYTATYTVSDGCGNFSYDVITITVVDAKKPTPYVTDHLVTEIMQTGMTQLINVNDYDIGSFDNCSDVVLSFSPDVTDTDVQFTCDDIGENTLEIWVTDEAGNQDFVTVTMEVQDNMEACGPGSLTVAGALHTSDEQGIEDATVDINGGLFTQVTDETGTFGFDLETGGDYSVVPSLDLNASNGVTTFDIVLITQHILGMNPFTDPLNLIAADANNSNTVTTLDVVAIRMVILQITDAFPNNTSWRFVDKDHVFTDPTNPWDFPEVVNINNLDEEMLDVDFTGIKIGDVNGSAQANFMSPAENRSGNSFELKTMDKQVSAGDEVRVTLQSNARISGMQFTLEHNGLEYKGMEAGLMNAEHVASHESALTFSWNEFELKDLSGEDLVTLIFEAKSTVQLSESMVITSSMTKAEGYTDQGIESVDLVFENNRSIANVLYQNVPNPFDGQTVVSFRLNKAGKAQILITDVDGKLIQEIEGTYPQGLNSVELDRIQKAGVYYYQLNTEGFTATKKMIKI